MPSGSTRTWNFASGVPFWPGTSKSISTSTAVPRMPMVATGVSIFMSPCLAVSPATNEMVPATRLISDGIVRPVGVVDHFVEHHPRVRRQAEHGAVDEGDAERRTGAGLDHVAFFDVVALVQDDRDAVADRGRGADELGDMADHLAGAGAAVGLRIFDMAGQRVDDVAGEMGAIGRRQRGALLALEVIVQDQFVVVLGKDQVDAGPLEVAVEQQMRVRDDDGVRRRVRGYRIDMVMGIGMSTRTVNVQLGVEFADEIQLATANG